MRNFYFQTFNINQESDQASPNISDQRKRLSKFKNENIEIVISFHILHIFYPFPLQLG